MKDHATLFKAFKIIYTNAKEGIAQGTNLGMTHIKIADIIIRTPLGGFYNHSNKPNVRKVVSDQLPKLKCGDLIDESLEISKIPDGRASRENLYPKVEGKYMFLVSTREIKAGEEITANYNLYTYPKTGIGIQSL